MSHTRKDTETILANLGIKSLNEMQQATLKAAGEQNDLILVSATGSGKTLAFLLPLVQRLDPDIKNVQAMVMAPSRELALQIDEVFRKMSTGFKVTCCYGGHKREIEENNLVQPPAVIIGTAGRIADHIRRKNFSTDQISTLVLDEFDKSLELGFQEEMSFIISSLPLKRQNILTSATESQTIPDFIQLNEPEKLVFAQPIVKPIEDELVVFKLASPDKDKSDTLFRLLCHVNNKSTIVFCNHRDAVEQTSHFLKEKGLVNVFYHGGMEQRDREIAMCKFKNGSSNILVTTDLASRGLDIPNIKYIVHYQLPATADVYTHRNGRTARMEAGGKSVILLSPQEYLPDFIKDQTEDLVLPEKISVPEKPKWSTLFIDAGKKDKINKVDIVGFLSKKGNLKMDDIGLIEVKDFFSFAAVRKLKVGVALEAIKDERLKNKKIKIAIAR